MYSHKIKNSKSHISILHSPLNLSKHNILLIILNVKVVILQFYLFGFNALF